MGMLYNFESAGQFLDCPGKELKLNAPHKLNLPRVVVLCVYFAE
jgi:hypothetical protein